MREEEFVEQLPPYRRGARKLHFKEEQHRDSCEPSDNIEDWIDELGDLVEEE